MFDNGIKYAYIVKKDSMLIIPDEYFPIYKVDDKYYIQTHADEVMFGICYLKCEEHSTLAECEERKFNLNLENGITEITNCNIQRASF